MHTSLGQHSVRDKHIRAATITSDTLFLHKYMEFNT